VTLPVRAATAGDAAELVRLAGVMFASMGMDSTDDRWAAQGVAHVRDRIGTDVVAFVVDDGDEPGRLLASAVGTVASRLPTPVNPSGLAGYVQWVCTEEAHRGRGLGRQVMTALLDWFDAQGVLAVELHSTVAAEALYASLGFSDDGPRAMRRRRW
jgi:GNAT superfamily N-acetyltransferase